MMRLMRCAAILVLAGVAASRGARAADADEDQPNPIDRSPGGDQTAAIAPAPAENRPPVWIVPPRRDSDERPPAVRFTLGLLFGTGYGWVEASGDVNRDILIKGRGWAQLGHVAPELGLIFPRAHLFTLLSFRYQKVTGTTDVYAGGQVYEARSSASALLWKFGWFPRAPRARVQPYLLLSTGLGSIVHTVRVNGVANCGPTMNEQCVDAVNGGDLFLGGGTGVRVRLSESFDAVAAVDVLGGAIWNGMINIDFSVGVAFIDSMQPYPEWQKKPPSSGSTP
jgi:hypothetical protein